MFFLPGEITSAALASGADTFLTGEVVAGLVEDAVAAVVAVAVALAGEEEETFRARFAIASVAREGRRVVARSLTEVFFAGEGVREVVGLGWFGFFGDALALALVVVDFFLDFVTPPPVVFFAPLLVDDLDFFAGFGGGLEACG